MEKFTYATSIDLNMGYYHITLDQHSRVSHELNLCAQYLQLSVAEENGISLRVARSNVQYC